MVKVLIAYFTEGGATEMMAQYIAEGIRIAAGEAVMRDICNENAGQVLGSFAGFIFGAPTYSLDMPEEMRSFLNSLDRDILKGRPAGAFGSYSHDVSYGHENLAPAKMLDLVEPWGMKRFQLGPLILKASFINGREGIRGCQQYGEEFVRQLPDYTL
jgi:flavodoxin